MSRTVAIVFGTYNRLEMLKRAVASVHQAVGKIVYRIIVVDGGSTDGSREWLRHEPDITVIEQDGPLTGAVKAFNLGFAYAVDHDYDYVCHLNDDAEFVTPLAIEKAIELMEQDATIGEVAFEFDLRGYWAFEPPVNGRPYANFGVVRRDVGMAVARAQGDPTGCAWWNPIYRTYGADTEFGVWVWKLGYRVFEAYGLRVHDMNAQDQLRRENLIHNDRNPDGILFWNRWYNERFVDSLPPTQSKADPVVVIDRAARDPQCLELGRHYSNCNCVDRSPFGA